MKVGISGGTGNRPPRKKGGIWKPAGEWSGALPGPSAREDGCPVTHLPGATFPLASAWPCHPSATSRVVPTGLWMKKGLLQLHPGDGGNGAGTCTSLHLTLQAEGRNPRPSPPTLGSGSVFLYLILPS